MARISSGSSTVRHTSHASTSSHASSTRSTYHALKPLTTSVKRTTHKVRAKKPKKAKAPHVSHAHGHTLGRRDHARVRLFG